MSFELKEQYEIFQKDEIRNSQSYLETLAGICGHVSSTFGEWEYGCISNFYRDGLHIHIFGDDISTAGEISWEGREVFSYQQEEFEEWVGEEVSEEDDMNEGFELEGEYWKTRRYFHTTTYVPGIWERQIMELYGESMKS